MASDSPHTPLALPPAPTTSSQSCSLTQTAVRTTTRVPAGHIICSEKWRGTDLVNHLQGGLNVVFEDRLGVVDFHPSGDTGVVYITEADLIAGALYKRKLAKLRMASSIRGVVLAEKTAASSQYFQALQKFTVLELGLVLMPVSSQSEAAHLLIQLVNVENRPGSNQFRLRKKTVTIDKHVLRTVQLIPGLGEVKAKALLDKFHSIAGMCTATDQALAEVVGKASASHIKSFFTQCPTGS